MPAPHTSKVCVVGLGYIGLPTAAVLASRGYTVHGVEVDARAAEIINSGRAHIVEPDLDILVRAAVETKKLEAHQQLLNVAARFEFSNVQFFYFASVALL